MENYNQNISWEEVGVARNIEAEKHELGIKIKKAVIHGSCNFAPRLYV